MVIVICATFSHIQQLLMVLLEQLREELFTHIIPQLWHSWKTPMHQPCVLYGLPWKAPLHHSMNIQLLLLQQAANARAWDCQGECVPLQPTTPLGHCSLSLFHCTALQHHTDTGHYPQAGIPQPNNPILNAKYRDAGEEKPPSSQQAPSAFPGWVRHGLFQGIQQWLWGQLTLRAATGKQQLQLTGRFGSESLAKCLLQQPKAAVLQ